ncbi:PREDICTED: RNA-binding protein 7 isoform X3 [Colobus angolensis palliatus]|uniref:RNA-binding protein 7 n=1 Tax=Colobus angolensis palliatus TaxID=336983 RepID=A0A2K5IGY2_COLAP|nr:PREDICTED: RNA-binding protein 7 isoform X3 [Colobus angolensis palliatus]
MGAAAAEADRTLFVGNLETKVTEELLFELFHQAGPVIKVKIPKDKDGKPKQFAFVNFKHEVSVPYAMNLLNGIKLYGRPIKIQFRSGSSHASQDVSLSYPQHHVGNSSPTSTSPSRYERTMDNMTSSAQIIQRCFSSPENFQRQAVVVSLNLYTDQLSHEYGRKIAGLWEFSSCTTYHFSVLCTGHSSCLCCAGLSVVSPELSEFARLCLPCPPTPHTAA